jgi:6-phosphogluconolactonase (cycloisomerase 2 family)
MFASLLGHFPHAKTRGELMRRRRAMVRMVAAVAAVAGLDACGGGGGGGGDPPPPPAYSVGGSVSGLATGDSVTLTNNHTDSLKVASNGAFTFSTQLTSGTAYTVAVATQPTWAQCNVSNGSGSVAASNVNNVVVACAPTTPASYSVGGSVSGLATGASVTLGDGTDSLKVSGNGAYTFPTQLKSGTAYTVSVVTPPTGEHCNVTNGSGSIATSNVTNVGITCAPVGTSTYSVGGSVSGLSTGASVTLTDNGTDSVRVSGNGAFTFPTQLKSGALYSVAVAGQPTGEQCSVANGSGWIGNGNVTNVAVSCTPLTASTYSVGGSVAGLSGGASVTLTDNGTDSLKVASNGAFTFPTKLKSGTAYLVAVATQPSGELCSVTNGSGTIVASNVTNVAVNCSVSATTATLLFVTNGTAGSIDGLSINRSTGVPSPISGSPFTDGPSPAAVAIDPQKRFLYVATTAGTIRGYVINSSTLKLTAISGSPFSTSANTVAITVDPSGQFVLTANGTSNTVSVFKIAATGGLIEVTGSPFLVGSGADPKAIVVAAGQFAYTANAGNKTLSAYRMDTSTGALKAVTGSPFPVAGSPNGLVVDVTGTHIYATQSGPNAVAGYSINGSTGALAAISGSPFAASYPVSSPVMDGEGYRLHATNGTDVDCFQVESSAGDLKELGLSYTNGKARALVLDRQDDFLYALDNVNNQVEVFSIDPNSDGSLTLISGSPFALFSGAGNDSLGPNAIAVQH